MHVKVNTGIHRIQKVSMHGSGSLPVEEWRLRGIWRAKRDLETAKTWPLVQYSLAADDSLAAKEDGAAAADGSSMLPVDATLTKAGACSWVESGAMTNSLERSRAVLHQTACSNHTHTSCTAFALYSCTRMQ